MRVLLTSNASHDPPKGGSTRSNLAWVRHLAAQGHECVAVAAGAEDRVSSDAGVLVESYKDLSFRAEVLSKRIREFAPDWVLVSSEDVSHILLREAGHAAAGRLVYLAHTPQFMPFGPEAWHRDPAATEIIRGAQGIVVIGHHMAGYVREHLGREASVIHPPIYGRPPWPNLGRFDAPFVLMINPCTVKGLPVFLALARPVSRIAVRGTEWLGHNACRPGGHRGAGQCGVAWERAGNRRRAARIESAVDAVALVRRLRADYDGGDAARGSCDCQRFGRTGGSQGRHRLRGAIAAGGEVRACVRRHGYAESSCAGTGYRALGTWRWRL